MIKSKPYRDMVTEEKAILDWLNNPMCIGYKRDIAYCTLDRVRYRKSQYEKAVKENRNART